MAKQKRREKKDSVAQKSSKHSKKKKKLQCNAQPQTLSARSAPVISTGLAHCEKCNKKYSLNGLYGYQAGRCNEITFDCYECCCCGRISASCPTVCPRCGRRNTVSAKMDRCDGKIVLSSIFPSGNVKKQTNGPRRPDPRFARRF